MSNTQSFTEILRSYSSVLPDEEKSASIKNAIVLIKVGGNALTDNAVKNDIARQISLIMKAGCKPVLVHGGGIEIKQLLDEVNLVSEFIGGHRKTDLASIRYIEMALSGAVNKELVSLLLQHGIQAVGLSGKDGAMVTSVKRVHIEKNNKVDLGFVGNVNKVDPRLVHLLLNNDYVPVISPVSYGNDGNTYNINADMFAGHLAASIGASKFIALTNINGLLGDINDPDTIIHRLSSAKAKSLFGSVIEGGMIPKIEACMIAVENGVETAHIINGTNKDELLRILLTADTLGTTISA